MDVDDWKPALDVSEEEERFGNVDDVGIVFISDKSGHVLLSWKLVFLLAPIRLFVGHEFPVSKLFGRIAKGSELLMAMSSMNRKEREGLVISIEAVC